MATLGQTAEQIMLRGIACTLLLKNGTRISCERITKTSITIIGTTLGEIEVLAGGQQRTILLDSIAQIE